MKDKQKNFFKKGIGSLVVLGGLTLSNVAYAACCYCYHSWSAGASYPWGELLESMNETTPEQIKRITTTTKNRLDQLSTVMLKSMNDSESAVVNKIQTVSVKVQDRLKKLGLSQIQSKTAAANYKNDKQFERNLQSEAAKFVNPITSCMQYAASGTFNTGLSHIKASAAATSFDIASSAAVAGQNGQVAWDQKEFQYNKEAFGDDKSFLNAGLLYSGKDGNLTRKDDDANAIPSLINYLVNYSGSPKTVSTEQDRTYNGRRYSALQRRNAALMALESYAITDTMLRAQPNKMLNAFYQAANLTMTPEQEENGVSLNELLNTYAQKMMSKPQIEFMATAPDTAILKSMLQLGSVNTLINLENLKSTMQQEALSAAELSLMSKKVLSPSLNVLSREIVYSR